jgi:hypothetical protein
MQTYIQGQGYGIKSLPAAILSNGKPFTIKQRPALLRNVTDCNRLFNHEFITKHNIRFQEDVASDDQLFVIKASVFADYIVAVPDTLYFYRKNRPGSISQYRGSGCMHIFSVWQEISDFVGQVVKDEALKHWINEVRVIKYLYTYNSADRRTQREYFSRMKSDFLTLDLEEQLTLLTPTERREYQVIMRHGFAFYNTFLRMRTIYGKLRKYFTKFNKIPSAE